MTKNVFILLTQNAQAKAARTYLQYRLEDGPLLTQLQVVRCSAIHIIVSKITVAFLTGKYNKAWSASFEASTVLTDCA
jgi:hypothetical protein